MHLSPILLSGLSLLPSTLAAGYANVFNNCTFPVYITSVGSSPGPQTNLTSKSTYTEPYRFDSVSGGIAIKLVRTSDGLYDASPVTQFDYTLSGTRLFYDLSDVYGDAFKGYSVVQVPSDKTCPGTTWANGVPGPNQVNSCSSAANVTVTVC